MCDLKKLLKDKIKLEVQIKHIDEKIKLILEEKEFKEEVIKNEFKEELIKVDFEEEEEERIVGDIEELEKELSEFKEINLNLELEKETFTHEFIPAFENPNDGFEVKIFHILMGLKTFLLYLIIKILKQIIFLNDLWYI
jgi:hypothetical protein